MTTQHQICAGCGEGALRAQLTDGTNAINDRLIADAVASSNEQIAALRAQAEEKGSKGSPALRQALGDLTAFTEGLMNEQVQALSRECPQRRVVCTQGGPTRFLGRCGAKVIEA